MKNLYGVLATTLLIAGCGPSAPPAPATPVQTPAPMAYGTLAQVMQAIPFHNSNIVYDAQSNDPEPKVEEKKGKEKDGGGSGRATRDYAAVYGGWLAVENAAIALQETANLITLPRMCRNGRPAPIEQEDYRKWAAGLAEAGKKVYAAAQSKSMANIESAADEMTTACSNCHEVYRDKDDEKDRCIPPAAAAK